MSAQVSIHGVLGVPNVNTDPICGRPRLTLDIAAEDDASRSSVTLFIASDEAGRSIGAALITAGSALVLQAYQSQKYDDVLEDAQRRARAELEPSARERCDAAQAAMDKLAEPYPGEKA